MFLASQQDEKYWIECGKTKDEGYNGFCDTYRGGFKVLGLSGFSIKYKLFFITFPPLTEIFSSSKHIWVKEMVMEDKTIFQTAPELFDVWAKGRAFWDWFLLICVWYVAMAFVEEYMWNREMKRKFKM